MSSNKIGFFTALGLYTAIFLAIWLLDFKIRIIGESGESQAFSIRLDNIAGENFGAGERKQELRKRVPLPHHRREHRLKPPIPRHHKAFSEVSNQNSDSPQKRAESSNNQSDSAGGSVSRAQSTLGENDPYFLAITRIINRFHAREPVRNLYGVVGVEFSVNTDGEMENLRVIKSSGSVKLDNIALKTIRRASRTFPTPKRTYFIKTALVYKRN